MENETIEKTSLLRGMGYGQNKSIVDRLTFHSR